MTRTFQRRMRDETLISVEEAQSRVLQLATRLPAEKIPLENAGGRVLREEIVSDRDVPPADNSAMDGYAIRAADLIGASPESPAILRVIEDLRAGAVSANDVTTGAAARIMTGATIPDGADAVVPVELTDAGTESVQIHRPVAAGTNIRPRGEDLRSGVLAIPAGTLLRAGEIGVLATLQRSHVEVAKKPRIVVVATGDELIGLEEQHRPGAVVNSNSYALAELIRETGGEAHIAPIVRDDLESTRQSLQHALSFDLVVTTGGVSAGAFDFVKDALEDLGAITHISKIAMKPGKPVVVSTLAEKVVFGLPGNPVSCMVAFTLFVAPLIRKMLGRRDLLSPMVRTRLLTALKNRGDRRAYQRVHVRASDGELVSEAMASQGSGVSSSMMGANGYAVTEPGVSLAAGEMVDTLLVGQVAMQGI